jgi:hypothetical protein
MMPTLITVLIAIGVLVNVVVLSLTSAATGFPLMTKRLKHIRIGSALASARRTLPQAVFPSLGRIEDWMAVRLPLARKCDLIRAGIPVTEARTKAVHALARPDLQVLAALNSR